jgi:hypothetical protein
MSSGNFLLCRDFAARRWLHFLLPQQTRKRRLCLRVFNHVEIDPTQDPNVLLCQFEIVMAGTIPSVLRKCVEGPEGSWEAV